MGYKNWPTEWVGDEIGGVANNAVIITAEGNPGDPVYVLTKEDGTRLGLCGTVRRYFNLVAELWHVDGAKFTACRLLEELGEPIPKEVLSHQDMLRVYRVWYEKRFGTRPALVEWDGRTTWEPTNHFTVHPRSFPPGNSPGPRAQTHTRVSNLETPKDKADQGGAHKGSTKMKIDVEVTETLTVKKKVRVTIPETLDFDRLATDDALREIEAIAHTLAHAELAIAVDSTWELIRNDGPTFEVGEIDRS